MRIIVFEGRRLRLTSLPTRGSGFGARPIFHGDLLCVITRMSARKRVIPSDSRGIPLRNLKGNSVFECAAPQSVALPKLSRSWIGRARLCRAEETNVCRSTRAVIPNPACFRGEGPHNRGLMLKEACVPVGILARSLASARDDGKNQTHSLVFRFIRNGLPRSLSI
jgi:hypothetical protein